MHLIAKQGALSLYADRSWSNLYGASAAIYRITMALLGTKSVGNPGGHLALEPCLNISRRGVWAQNGASGATTHDWAQGGNVYILVQRPYCQYDAWVSGGNRWLDQLVESHLMALFDWRIIGCACAHWPCRAVTHFWSY